MRASRHPHLARPVGASVAAALVAAVVWLAWTGAGDRPGQAASDARPQLEPRGVEEGVDAALTRAIEAVGEHPHGGQLTVVSFAEAGPRISEVRVTRSADAVHLARAGGLSSGDGWEVGSVDGDAFLRSSDQLLRLGGVEPPPVQLDRLRVKYLARLGEVAVLDTGPATVLHLFDRAAGILRENLYLDEETGLIVRRETFGADGEPVRLVAYTELHVDAATIERPSVDGLEVRDHAYVQADVDQLVADGRTIPQELPGGFELIAATEVDASTPAVHLLYGDGLYSLSLFQQDGRMARTAVRGATELATPDGGAVWRWPGSEPRRVVWTGGGRTFTVLTDAPTDELLDAIAGLPVDPPPSILDRLQRGITRAGHWLSFGDGSDP